jgi:hypothetical protein
MFKTEIKNQKPIADDTLSRPTYYYPEIMITQDETLADTLHTNRLCPPPRTRAAAQLFWIEAGGDVWFTFNYGPEMTRYHSADPIWPDGRVPLVLHSV